MKYGGLRMHPWIICYNREYKFNVYNNNRCMKLFIKNPEFINPSPNRGTQPIPQRISVYSGPRGLFLDIILLPLLRVVTF
jgi:hypothetical protein